jgi:tellurite resistance protein
MLRDRLAGAGKRLDGKTDFLEGVAAAMAYASMSGGISQDEFSEGVDAAMQVEILTANFKPHQIEAAINKMYDKGRKDTFSARAALLKEVREACDKMPEEKLTILYAALDAVKGDGVDDGEFKMIQDIAKITGGNPAELLGR